ncbi:MAG: alpha/beta hydrolase-fold protein [Haliscomenobacter sp.]|uniref:alpha/beta hydrolase n=1 Tax=Haliscomenobacter sp. TaxID=2717303 RepID=UPI0029B8A25E|nr:alpha/beta hydrolase-fold protein [Haliscomenobacter sp.]MDX2068633.1 alpha/beta hydrolase-fold protein [Haliscomenobacter sp.]
MHVSKLGIPIVLFWVIVFILNACAKEESTIAPAFIKQFQISSTNTGTTYPIYVVLPSDYEEGKQFKTIYVLDGDGGSKKEKTYQLVGRLVEEAKTQTQKTGAIVVAIGNAGERIRDFTPTSLPSFDDQGGGIEAFTRFIEFELVPKIEKEFAVYTHTESRAIAGHSLGGSFGAYLFAKHPNLFSNYLLLSPALWWDDGVTLRYELENRSNNAPQKTLVYVGCGELEEAITILAEEWYLRLQKYYPNCKSTFVKIRNTSHNSSMVENFEQAIHFYYR